MRISFESCTIEVSGLGKVGPDPNWRIHAHSHTHHELHFITQGRGCNTLDKGELDFYPNVVYMAPPHETHAQRSDRTEPLELYYSSFTIELPEKAAPLPRIYAPCGFLAADLQSIMQRLKDDRLTTRMIASLQLGELVCRTIEPYLEPSRAASADAGLDEAGDAPYPSHLVLEQAVAYIRRHFRRNPPVAEIASACHVSVRHLSRLFHEQLRVSVHDAVRRERFQWAAAELATAGCDIQSVAERLGFATTSYFSQWFKQQSGLTPSEYRGKLQRPN